MRTPARCPIARPIEKRSSHAFPLDRVVSLHARVRTIFRLRRSLSGRRTAWQRVGTVNFEFSESSAIGKQVPIGWSSSARSTSLTSLLTARTDNAGRRDDVR
jgi:hypothetical protein